MAYSSGFTMSKIKKKQMHLQMESFAASVAHKKKKKNQQ